MTDPKWSGTEEVVISHTQSGLPQRTPRDLSPAAIERQALIEKALEWRLQGKNIAEISRLMGVSRTRVRKYLDRGISQMLPIEDLTELKKIEIGRLQKLWEVAYVQAQSGDLDAVGKALDISKRISAMLGLDAPIKQAIAQKAELEVVFADGSEWRMLDGG